MKKTLTILAVAIFLCHGAIAAPCSIECTAPCDKNCKQYNPPKCEESKPYTKPCNKPCEKSIGKNTICEDNKCFFDNQFKKMKKMLCLTPQQESAIDCIYDKYKNQMQIFHDQAQSRANKLCHMLNEECLDNQAIKMHKNELKEIRKDAKEQYKCFAKEIKTQLCKDQKRTLNKYYKTEKKKMKKLAKYCFTPHFPCDCGCEIKRPCNRGCK